MDLIQMIKALSDETRLRILNLLRQGELCVCELEMILDINQSNASRHLNRLTNAKILNFYKKAQYVYYKIDENILEEHAFIREILDSELKNIEIYNIDLDRLKKFKKSGLSCDDIKEGKNCFKN